MTVCGMGAPLPPFCCDGSIGGSTAALEGGATGLPAVDVGPLPAVEVRTGVRPLPAVAGKKPLPAAGTTGLPPLLPLLPKAGAMVMKPLPAGCGMPAGFPAWAGLAAAGEIMAALDAGATGVVAPGLMIPTAFGPDEDPMAMGLMAAAFAACALAVKALAAAWALAAGEMRTALAPGLEIVAFTIPCAFGAHFEAPHFTLPHVAPAGCTPAALGIETPTACGAAQPCCCNCCGCCGAFSAAFESGSANEAKTRPFNLSWASSPRSMRSNRMRRASSANLAKTPKVSMSSASWLSSTAFGPRNTASKTKLTSSVQLAQP
mmetsp:Transcript_145823/g.467298  ORF Transcript_145823/g.467298 Transcript_145823/m.467298 type:complete len:318 (-) Transcript_145823:2386-3339(-)